MSWNQGKDVRIYNPVTEEVEGYVPAESAELVEELVLKHHGIWIASNGYLVIRLLDRDPEDGRHLLVVDNYREGIQFAYSKHISGHDPYKQAAREYFEEHPEEGEG